MAKALTKKLGRVVPGELVVPEALPVLPAAPAQGEAIQTEAPSASAPVAAVDAPSPAKGEAVAPAKPEAPSATPAPVTAVDAPAEPEKIAPTPARRTRIPRGVVYLCAVLTLLIVLYVWSPYHAADSLWKALNDGDQAELENVIDFPSVRESLKEQMQAQVAQSGDQGAQNGTPPDTASLAVLSMIDNSIDLYVTPSGISLLANKSDHIARSDNAQTVSPEAASSILVELNNQPLKKQGLASLNDFVIDLDIARLHLKFSGLGWKLNRIELKPDLQLLSLSASPASPVDSSSPLASPVVETYMQQGNAKCEKGDWAGAIIDFTQVLTINPKMSVAYSNRGFARLSKEDYDGAEFDYTRALELDPKLAGAYDERANAKTDKSDFDGAIADYTQSLLLDPNQANSYSNRGFARQAKGDYDGAIADYTQALAINPKIDVAYYNRGLARQAQGNLDAAILDYNQALDLDPKLARAYYNRGNAKNTKYDFDGAIADYTQALVLDPKIALAYCYRGVARQAKGDFDGALADYAQALALDPKIALAYYNRGLIKQQRNDLDGAIADSTQALDLDPKNAQAYYNRGLAKLTKGNLAGAIADLEQFCTLAPRDHYADNAHLYLWLISKAQNSKIDPDQELADALQSSWNSSPDDLTSKIALFLLGHISETDLFSAATSTDAKKDQGQHCEAWYFAGMKHLLDGDKATAIDYFHKCLATGQKDYCEYILAQAELKGLEPGPKQ